MEIQLWREILDPYRQAVDELTVKFEHMIEEHHNAGLYCPIVQVSGRVKKISSILEKCQRKNVPMEELEEKIEDIAGIRIICQFVEDIEKVVEIIRKRSDVIIKKEKDYITNSKESGYRSYHVILECPFPEAPDGVLRVEIQLRTIAMDCWASLEHEMRYKKGITNTALIEKELKRCAGEMASTDLSMQTLRDMIRQ